MEADEETYVVLFRHALAKPFRRKIAPGKAILPTFNSMTAPPNATFQMLDDSRLGKLARRFAIATSPLSKFSPASGADVWKPLS